MTSFKGENAFSRGRGERGEEQHRRVGGRL